MIARHTKEYLLRHQLHFGNMFPPDPEGKPFDLDKKKSRPWMKFVLGNGCVQCLADKFLADFPANARFTHGYCYLQLIVNE